MKIYFLGILVLTFVASCSKKQNQASHHTNAPKVVAAKGYVVPKDSMDEPKVILIDEKKLRRLPVGEPTVVPTNTNVHPVGIPKIVEAGIPRVITLGQDTFPLPKTVPAIHNPTKAGIPQVVIAKDPALIDPNPQSFSSLSKLQGLKDGNIVCMLEDRRGNLWLSTRLGGVSKYDGKSFTHVSILQESSKGFYAIGSMLEDRYGSIWFASGQGVAKYDGKFITQFTEKEGLIDNEVRSMVEDRNGDLWFATGSGVSQLNPEAKTFTHFTTKEGLSGNDIYAILEDNDGNLWFGTGGRGATRLSQDRKSLAYFTEKEGLGNNYVTKIVEDHTGHLWFNNPSRGASRLSPDRKSFAYFTTNEGLNNDWVRTIFEDKSGNIWFGHLDAGACRLSKDGKFFTHFTKKEGLSNLDVTSILEDRSGNLWLGTGDGLIKYSGRSFSHYTDSEGLSNNYVWSILEDKDANLWFGHDNGGVSRLNPGKKSFARFTWKEGLSGMSVWAILEDKGGNLWFGSIDNGVTQLSADRKYFTHFTEEDGLCGRGVLSMLEDKNGNIWFGTGSGGVSRLSLDRKTFTNYSKKQGLVDNFVSAIEEDKNGNFWFATSEGVTRLSKDGKSFTNFTEVNGLGDNVVWSVIDDKGGNLWFGTNGGLSQLSSDEKFFTHYTKKEGLSDNVVDVMLEDRNENLWFGTLFGLNKLTNEKSRSISNEGKFKERDVIFKTFTFEDGFLGIGCMANSIFEDREGTIWIGANNRLTAYHPEGEIPDTIPPNIQLTGLALSNENINWSELENKQDTSFILGNGVSVSDFEFDGISHWYFLPQNLSLAHHNNSLTFNFVGISQKSPQKVKYQYKLEGNDDSWSTISTRSDAPYGNLPPGAYTFRVKAMNSEGYWSDEFEYKFTIRPPWWKTWWAYSLYGLTLIGIFISWRNYEIKRLKLKHRAEHLSELDTLKTRFFANISHEFRTPITLILGPLKDLYNATNNDEQKNLFATMMRNGQRLLRLINQLLDLSKLEAGKMTLLVTRIDLVQFLKDIASSYESLARDKRIKFAAHADVPELHVYLDEEKIEKVIYNILSNAFKFTNENGEVKLYLSAENKQAVISIKDTGIGIPDHQKEKIFDRFYQVDSSQTRSYEGSGIGMALAKELVELHHGSISVESKEGEGSIFTVRLPLNQKYLDKDIDHSTDFKRKKLISYESISEVQATETKTGVISESVPVLLIVEDNTDMRNYISKTLKGSYTIEESVNGKDGVKKAKEMVPDLIISDIMMPEMDGYQLCELIKADEVTSHIPVILLTAKADHQSKLKGLEQRADDYLLKPFDADELKLIVRNHIEERQKMRERFSREIMLEPAQISISSQDEKFLQRVLGLIEEHMEDENFSIEDFSREAGYSRMQFYRKIKALAGQTPSQFVRTIRLKRAAQMLIKKSDNIAQIAYAVGFGNVAYFNKCFKDQFGVTPGQFSNESLRIRP